jgi:hypothetical protein
MQDITISGELIQQAIIASLPEILKNKFSASYGSPISDIVEKEITEQKGQIRTFVAGIITDALNDPKFKEELGKMVLTKLVEKGLHS